MRLKISARKLRRGQANLLPGRVLLEYLPPLVYWEIRHKFDLHKASAPGIARFISVLPAKASSLAPMNHLLGSSITYRIAKGPQQGRKVFTLRTLPDCGDDHYRQLLYMPSEKPRQSVLQ
jgi:hypothetical protein